MVMEFQEFQEKYSQEAATGFPGAAQQLYQAGAEDRRIRQK